MYKVFKRLFFQKRFEGAQVHPEPIEDRKYLKR